MATGPHAKLEVIHERFIRTQLAGLVLSSSTIADKLADPESNDKYGFEPITVTRQCVGQAIIRIKKTQATELAQERAEFLLDFSDVPLAHKKKRVEALEAMYHKVTKMKKVDGKAFSELSIQNEQRAILRQISDEMGEDTERLADAIRSTASDIPPKTVTPAKLTQLAFIMTQIAQTKQVSDGNAES